MPTPDPKLAAAVLACIEIPVQGGPPFVLGLCGSQGSGKSTLASWLEQHLLAEGVGVVTISLDDLYLPRSERARLAREVHPLFRTRGVPGAHDAALGLDTFAALDTGAAVALPRFDKGSDDRPPVDRWDRAPENCQVVIFEGWCVGARPQVPAALDDPVNALEADEDSDGVWRQSSNSALAGPYQKLFARIDRLVLLAAPSFEVVLGWRMQQEEDLRARVGDRAPGVMGAAELSRFVSHYERLTRHILAEMPQRADLVAWLDEERRVTALTGPCAQT